MMSDADWLAVVEVHLNGTMRSCREAFELLRASEGAIVNLSSISASHGMPMRASYCAVKSGIEGADQGTGGGMGARTDPGERGCPRLCAHCPSGEPDRPGVLCG